jgi:hypothetical protein
LTPPLCEDYDFRSMDTMRRFWPAFRNAARQSLWWTVISAALAGFSLVGGTIFWLTGLPAGAVFSLMFAAVLLVALAAYHSASIAWAGEADAVAPLEQELREASTSPVPEPQPMLRFGEPVQEVGISVTFTQVRGTGVETSVGISGEQQRKPGKTASVTRYRIPVSNDGAAVEQVTVKLVAVDPDIDGVLPPVTLHVVGDDHPYELSQQYRSMFPLHKGDTAYIDVVAMDESRPETCYLGNIACQDAMQEVELGGTRRLTLRAYAGNEPAEERYEVYADAMSARLEMRGPLQKERQP